VFLFFIVLLPFPLIQNSQTNIYKIYLKHGEVNIINIYFGMGLNVHGNLSNINNLKKANDDDEERSTFGFNFIDKINIITLFTGRTGE
jgi:hypothetical protein